MPEVLTTALVVAFIIYAVLQFLFAVLSWIFDFEYGFARFLLFIVIPVMVLALFGPAAVLLATQFNIVDSGSFLWQLRNESFISAKTFFYLLFPLILTGATYIALWRSKPLLSRFVALSLARLAQLYAAVPVAVYSVILVLGGYTAIGYLATTLDAPSPRAPEWAKDFWPAVVVQQHLSFVPYVFVGAIVALAGVLLGLAPIPVFYRGTKLTHQLFRYYYPWQLVRRSRLWPSSGYIVNVGEVQRVDVLVASDLHVTEVGGKTIEPSDESEPEDSLGLFREMVKRFDPPIVVVTGDLTDTGSKAQWKRVSEQLPGSYELVLLPGNHDYHFRHIAMGTILGGLGFGGSFKSKEIYSHIRQIAAGHDTFPVLHNSERLPLDILALDSNIRQSGWPMTNAVGMVGREQLAKASNLLYHRDRSRVLIIALHHHVIPPSFTLQAPFLLCLDRDDILQLAVQNQAHAIVHGHTHQPFVYRHESGLLIISCGSTRFMADGPFADVVRTQSSYGLQLDGSRITGVKLLQAA